MSAITPFKIDVPQEQIDKLHAKLAAASFTDEVAGAGWDMGSPLADVQRLTRAWQTFDWRAAEARLNQVPQFRTDVEVDRFGMVNVHFVHQKAGTAKAIPLLFVHGWPGSFIEVLKLLPLLAQRTGGAPAFDIVAPSLPNYGFSGGVKQRGFGIAQYAETCHKLMLKLGYPEYVTQGGDWGFFVTRAIGILYPESCKASHVNYINASPPEYKKNPLLALKHNWTPYTEREKKAFERNQWFVKEGRGYNLEQSTKPQTLAYALHDSPVALLAWIYEKLHDWTDNYPFTDEEILTWISIYQFSTAGPGAAHRIYYETAHTKPDSGITRDRAQQWVPHVKLGLAHNPKELTVVPKSWAYTLGDVVYYVQNEHGGHFYAHEHPEWLARDLKVMFGKGGGAFAVVKGKNGYEPTAKL